MDNSRETKKVVVLALPYASLTNVFGVAEVFVEANQHSARLEYQVRIESVGPQQWKTDSMTEVLPQEYGTMPNTEVDTLLLAGGFKWPFEDGAQVDRKLLDGIKESCRGARRFGGICSGSMLLAEAGLLNLRNATTHWSWLESMAKRYADVRVMSDRIYVKDGNCYTAAGGASSIDLALSIVEEDMGADVALAVAKKMVLFLRRNGAEPQLSTTLLAQTSQVKSVSNLLVWMADNLDKDLAVPVLARRVAMSPRNFARHFVQETGKTPGRHVNDLRLEAACRHLANEELSLSEVARASGFGSVEVFRRIFSKSFGMPPGRYRAVQQHVANDEAQQKGVNASHANSDIAPWQRAKNAVFEGANEELQRSSYRDAPESTVSCRCDCLA